MAESKTSTFTFHHDRCKPETWTPNDILQFASFVRTGDLRYAGHLSRLGVQLVLSEHHVPKGGQLEEIGWACPDEPETLYRDLSDAVSWKGDNDVTELYRVYRAPSEFVARFLTGDGEEVDGTEYEVKPTRDEAEAFIASLSEPETADTPA